MPACAPIRRLRHLAAGAALLHLLTLAAPAYASLFEWINSSGGSSATPGNWAPLGPPVGGDLAHFSINNGIYNVAWTSPADTVGTVLVDKGRVRFFCGTMRVGSQSLFESDSLTLGGGTYRTGRF